MKLKSLPLLASARARAPGSFYLTAAHKLEHDADQLELLLARGKLPAAFGALRDRLRALRAELLGDGARAGDAALVGYRLLTSAQLRATCSFERLITTYVWECEATACFPSDAAARRRPATRRA